MKKLFLALMAMAAMTFVGCKPQNEPEESKSEMKLFYEVKLTGSISDYVKLNLRYINIPDSNDILVKENITSSWKPTEYSVEKDSVVFVGLEPSIRATELFKQTFSDQAKHKTMVESNSTMVIAMGYKDKLPDGHVKVEYLTRDSINLSGTPFDASMMETIVNTMEHFAKAEAYRFKWDEKVVYAPMIYNFWDRH